MANGRILRLLKRISVMSTVACLLASGSTNAPTDEAELKFRSALRKNPSDLEARLGLARVLMEKDSRVRAIEILKEGAVGHPMNAPLLNALAAVYFAWGRGARDPGTFKVAEDPLKKLVDAGSAGAETFKILGYVEKRLGRDEEALGLFAMGTQLDPGDAFNRARLGYEYTLTGGYEKGLSLLREAVQRGNRHFFLWWWLGDTQQLLGDYDSSLKSLNEALMDVWPERRQELARVVGFTYDLLLQTKEERACGSHRALGDRHNRVGRYDRAIAEYKKALDLTPPDKPGWVALFNDWLSRCYRKVDKLDLAIEYALRAIEAYEKAGNVKLLAITYGRLGGMYGFFAEEGGQTEEEFVGKAIKAYEMEEHYARQAGETEDVVAALANLCILMGDWYGVDDPRVRKYREQIVQHIPADGRVTSPAQCEAVQCEAQMRLHQRDYAGARDLYKRLENYWADPNGSTSADLLASLYNNLSYLSHKLGNRDEALADGQKCVAALSRLRSMVGTDEFKRSAGAETARFVFSHTLVPAALQKGDDNTAFNYAEQYKGRALLDLLGTKPAAGKRRTLDRKRLEKGLAIARLQELEKQLAEARSDGASQSMRTLERTLTLEKTKYDRLAEDINVADLEVKSFEDIESLRLEQLQPLTDRFTLVTYVVGDHSTCAIVLTRDSLHGIEIKGASEEELPALIQAFRSGIGVRSAMGRDIALEVEREKKAAPEKVKKGASQELYKLLIEPVLPYIKTKLIIISPDSVLNYLPFEALEKNGRYLIEDYAIAYAPSASVLKICMDRNRNRREKVLAFGNPNLKNPAFRLVHAEDEVNSLKGLFPQVDVYTGDGATESVLKEHGGEYDILHFACHGELNLDEPMLTSLRLAPDQENDGYLHAGEVFDYDLSASLVVLSACNSALGELTSGNELMGLTRSFLYAGVPSIIASLWTVDDRSTAYLMQEFYRNLGTMDKAEALRQAKLGTMKKYPSPFHWAAFCLQGDYR